MFIISFLPTTRKCRANIIPYRPNASSIFYPEQTEVRFATLENIYIYAVYKLWLAYGLAIGATALIVLFGVAAIIANQASFSNKFSTIFRLSRGAQLSNEIDHADLSGRAPLPAYAEKATVRFSQEQISGTKDSNACTLVDREGKDDEREAVTQGGRLSNRNSMRSVSEVSLVASCRSESYRLPTACHREGIISSVSESESECQSDVSWSNPESAAPKRKDFNEARLRRGELNESVEN